MGRIHVMSETLASQVAAGEVVERPASVVKELVENSLDAGATRVDVLIRRGGVSLIKIVDNGHGMSREDALLCLERHATSKLRTSEDLAGITTLGFRGEAVPSIASVSRFTLDTRELEAMAGTRITVEGGTVLAVEDSGESPGTHMEVRNLFYNVPARRKFLKAESTEFSHIDQIVRLQALAHPSVAFSLKHDDRLVFQLAAGSLGDRIRQLFGTDVFERMLEIPEQREGNLTVSGYLGDWHLFRPSKSFFCIFLNHRPVESVAFSQAFRAAYGDALPRGQHPVAVLHVQMPPDVVDVNVHPAKKEVRFVNSLSVQANLTTVLAKRLRQGRSPGAARISQPREEEEVKPAGGDVSSFRNPPASPQVPSGTVTRPVPRWQAPVRQPELVLPTMPETRAEYNALGGQRADSAPAMQSKTLAAMQDSVTTPDAMPPPQVKPRPEALLARNPYRIMGVLSKEYVVMEGTEGLVLLDFRAAWHRILFEEARLTASAQETASQRLLVPVTLQLGPREFDLVKHHMADFDTLGVHLEEFGPLTIKVDALPASFRDMSQAENLVHDLIEDFARAVEKNSVQRLDLAALANIVSARSSRIRLPGSLPELDAVVCRLLACEMPYTDPNGKATLIQISLQELARKFGRR